MEQSHKYTTALCLFLTTALLTCTSSTDATSNCGWNSSIALVTDGEPFHLKSPQNSESTGEAECQITIKNDGYSFTKVEVTSFDLGRQSGSCGPDRERLDIRVDEGPLPFKRKLYGTRYTIGWEFPQAKDHWPGRVTWCGRTYADNFYFSGNLTLTFYPKSGHNNPGFDMVFQTSKGDRKKMSLSLEHQPEKQAKLLYTPGFFNLVDMPYECYWEAEENKTVYVLYRLRDLSGEYPCYERFNTHKIELVPGTGRDPTEIWEYANLCEDSVIITAEVFRNFLMSTTKLDWQRRLAVGAALEYKLISRVEKMCKDSTPMLIEDSFESETVFIVEHDEKVYPRGRCNLEIVVDSVNSGIDITFHSHSWGGAFKIDIVDGDVMTIENFELFTGHPRIQTSSNRLKLSFKYNHWSGQPFVFSLRAYNKADPVTDLVSQERTVSYHWISPERIRQGINGAPSQILHRKRGWHDKVLRIKTLSKDGKVELVPAKNLAIYDGDDNSYFNLAEDCTGTPYNSKKLHIRRKKVSIVPLSNAAQEGFWLVYESYTFRHGRHAPIPKIILKDLPFLTEKVFQISSEVMQRNAECVFQVGKRRRGEKWGKIFMNRFKVETNISPDDGQIMYQVDQQYQDPYQDPRFNTGWVNGYANLPRGKYVYTQQPTSLGFVLSTLHKEGHGPQRFFNITLQSLYVERKEYDCTAEYTVGDEPKYVFTPFYDNYFFNRTFSCDWKFKKSPDASNVDKHIVIEAEGTEGYSCDRVRETLKIGPIKDGEIEDSLVRTCFRGKGWTYWQKAGRAWSPFHKQFVNKTQVGVSYNTKGRFWLTAFNIKYRLMSENDYKEMFKIEDDDTVDTEEDSHGALDNAHSNQASVGIIVTSVLFLGFHG